MGPSHDPSRNRTLTGQLIRAGVSDVVSAARNLESLGVALEDLPEVADAADPDLAIAALVRVVERSAPGSENLMERLASQEVLRRRVLLVLGASMALGDHVARHPDHLEDLAGSLEALPPERMTADVRAAVAVAGATIAERVVALRVAYRRILLRVAARDLAEGADLGDVAGELAHLADAVLAGGLDIAHIEVLGEPGTEGAREPLSKLAVIGMGKCGARELNYVSDVDVIFVGEPREGADETAALKEATALASGLMRACSAATSEGTIWEVDAGLRPEGKAGALVRTLRSHVGYYERWAKTWEFQALLKARVSAGDEDLGSRYADAVLPFVWSAATRDGFVKDVQAMRRRVEDHIPAREADRELKLGKGGLRDIEFAVQLLQLVHGRSDVMVRSSNTLQALEALATWGYVGREDAAGLARAYRFLRQLEHMIQIHRLRRTHTLPDSPEEMRRLGRAMGYRTDPAGELDAAWRKQAMYVRRIHEKLFYRPLLTAVANLEPGEVRLTPEAARERMEALGFRDPGGAYRNLEALSSGVTRRSVIQRTLLPVMLGWFADGIDPDAGLLGFRRVSEALGGTPWYLRLLRDQSATAERLAKILATSPYATDLLLRAPEAVRLLASEEDLAPSSREGLIGEGLSLVGRQDDPNLAINAVRGLRRRELFRISCADILGLLTVEQVADALTDLADVTLICGLQVATAAVEAELGHSVPCEIQIVGMGRYGGAELGYSSDLDVMFVYRARPDAEEQAAARAALAIANRLRNLLHQPSPDPPVELDADLRPEGKNGPLVRTLNSYRAYYERFSSTWEVQALLRADKVAGDEGLGDDFLSVIEPVRWPENGLTARQVTEIRRLKARMEAERLPRGADPTLHLKLGRGGLSDVEWTIQLMQLQHAHAVEGLRTARTLKALKAAEEAKLIAPRDAEKLADAWRLATRVRNAITLTRGRSTDSLPTDPTGLSAVARLLGYPAGFTGLLIDDYRRVTRHARGVMDRSFYGVSESG